MLVPLYGFLEGDTVGLLVLVQHDDKVADIAACLTQAACVRVAPRAGGRVVVAGRALDPDLTVVEAGLSALDRVDVVLGEDPDAAAPRTQPGPQEHR